jgi:hypothetical protein
VKKALGGARLVIRVPVPAFFYAPGRSVLRPRGASGYHFGCLMKSIDYSIVQTGGLGLAYTSYILTESGKRAG